MWNRPEDETPGTPSTRGGRAVIGPSISIRGQLEGSEDLQIDGTFQGEIQLTGHQVVVGSSGRVKAEIRAKVIVVEGELQGNLDAEQQAVVRSTGRVHGDIRAPRVALEEGCQFKGNIDMEPGREGQGKRGPEARNEEKRSGGPEPRKEEKGGGGPTPVAAATGGAPSGGGSASGGGQGERAREGGGRR